MLQVKVNLSKQTVTNFLKQKTTYVRMNSTPVKDYLQSKNSMVKLGKITILNGWSLIKKKVLCCTICSIFLPGGEVSVYALVCVIELISTYDWTFL